MTPQTKPKRASRKTRATIAIVLSAAVLSFVAVATPASAVAPEAVTLCHATGSESNPFVEITIAPQAVIAAHIDHQHDEDIIPEFTYGNVTYSQNLDAAGLSLLSNDCNAPGSTSSSTTAPPSSTSGSTTDDNSTEVPFFTSPPALALGLGGSLVATLLMLRRRL